MSRRPWTLSALTAETLRRQFPAARGRGPAAVRSLFERIGPVQSQVPRTPFLTAATRLPGVTYATVAAELQAQRLVKATTLRGTVHVSTPQQHAWSAAVSAELRASGLARLLGLDRAEVDTVTEAIEVYCADGWRTRDEVVAHGLAQVGRVGDTSDAAANHLWGHPALLRRPTDGAWERRTDTLRRTMAAPSTTDADAARVELVRVHLAAYGPATRRDIAWWLGDRVTAIDRAVAALGDEVGPVVGPDTGSAGTPRDPLLDLAEPPTDGLSDPGVRLLPEFDGVLLGFHPANRGRFLAPEHLPHVWNRANGLFAPLVLAGGRIAATWRTSRAQRRTGVEITLLPAGPTLTESDVADAVTATATALALEVSEVRISSPGRGSPPGG
jgi:hypothetical protein